jgi:ATP-dependent Clp protease ATP-binding subunit ClpX
MEILTTLYKNQTVVKSNLDKDLIAKLKENILIYGETGTGKTEILKRISSIYNIPIVIEDATMLSETGYQGRKITDVLEDLYNASNNNRELAEKSILVIDEFDKLAEKDNESHVSRIGVQRSLLKLLDGSVFYFNNKVFDTSKLTIVAIGAFTDIKDNYKNITTDDLIKYGIIRELVARFSKTIAMNKLTKEDIIKIIKESNFSPINTYKELFKLLNVEFNYTDEYIDYIADIASNKNTGARSIKTIFDNSISSALFRIFQGEYESITLDKPNTNEKAYTLVKKKL